MDDKKFKEHAKFEETHDCTVFSPSLLQKLAGMDGTERIEDIGKKKQQFFYLVFQDSDLRITKIEHGNSYDNLWREGIEKAKEYGGFWSVFSLNGKFVDGNVVSK